jgi:hypothetical protein
MLQAANKCAKKYLSNKLQFFTEYVCHFYSESLDGFSRKTPIFFPPKMANITLTPALTFILAPKA